MARLAAILLTAGILGGAWIPRVWAAPAAGPVLVTIDGISAAGAHEQDFALSAPTRLLVRSEGLADSKGTVFLAQGWILDLNSRKPVWSLSQAHGRYVDKTGDWSAQEDVTLPAGIYCAWFAAEGGNVPLNETIKVLGLPIGKIEGNVGHMVRWNEKGSPSLWGLWIQAEEAGAETAPLPASLPGPDPGADLRFLGLPDRTAKRAEIDCRVPVALQVHFTGEYSAAARAFADVAMITDRATWRRVWEPDRDSTQCAGGDQKNRVFRGTVRLAPGSYLLTVLTDGSHAPGDWNAPPPWDPDSWGVSLTAEGSDRSGWRIVPDAGLPAPVITIDRVGDNQCIRRPFLVSRPVRALVRSYGERASDGGWADHGWIERASDLEAIWIPDQDRSSFAGGAAKNRLVESVVDLKPGAYELCFATDDSHAFGDWNAEEPWEPEAWGITLAELGSGSWTPENSGERTKGAAASEKPTGAVRAGSETNPPTQVALAPVGSSQHLVKRFDITQPAKVLLVAEGEGRDGDLTDYGWLVEESTGRTVWTMKYDDTVPAGGAEKNRLVRTELSLPTGSYALHFQTDDSHAYGDWNETLPLQPELWGVTLIELP